MCAFFIGNKTNVNIIAYKHIDDSRKGFEILKTIELNEFLYYDNLILYNTQDENHKILCASKKLNNEIKCCAIYVKAEYSPDSKNIDKSLYKKDLKINGPDSRYHVSLYKTHKCYFTEFNSEFLLCCGISNTIHCHRKNTINFESINEFLINLKGNINNLIINNKGDHAIISYKNTTTLSNKYLYSY